MIRTSETGDKSERTIWQRGRVTRGQHVCVIWDRREDGMRGPTVTLCTHTSHQVAPTLSHTATSQFRPQTLVNNTTRQHCEKRVGCDEGGAQGREETSAPITTHQWHMLPPRPTLPQSVAYRIVSTQMHILRSTGSRAVG